MLKKGFKALLWVGKWYLRLTILLWAFVGIGEVAEQFGRLSGTWKKVRNIKDRKTRWQYKKKLRRIIQNYVWDMTVAKWKFGLGLPIKKKSEEATEEKEDAGE